MELEVGFSLKCQHSITSRFKEQPSANLSQTHAVCTSASLEDHKNAQISTLLQSQLCASPRLPSQMQLFYPEEKTTLFFPSLLLKNTGNFTVAYFYSAFFYI